MSDADRLGNQKQVEKLIKSGADINATDKYGKTALFYAVEKGNEKMIKKMIDSGADVNSADKNGETVLFHAVDKQNVKIVKRLIECGADVNATNEDGKNFLTYAIWKENENMVKKLIACRADVNSAANQNSKTGLFCAAEKKDEKLIKEMIDCGADVNATNKDGSTVLFYALSKRNKKMVKTLIQCGADINATDEDGKTPLFCAVEGGKEMVKILIQYGADINATDENGRTPLFCAIEGDKEMVKTLIECGADINATDKDGRTPLFCAVEGDKEMVKTLIMCGADIDATDEDGRTPLFCAVEGDKEMVKTLIMCGADINATDEDGKTPLFCAVVDHEMVKTLIQCGADINATDEDGKTPLFCAIDGDKEMVKTLIQCGADINATDEVGKTPLFKAVHYQIREMVETLIQYGADINVVDTYGTTALFYAIKEKKREMVETLIQYGADINVADTYGATALLYAVFKENVKMVKKLIECGADINAKDEDGQTALCYAVKEELEKMVEKLIENGADVNATDEDGKTVLFDAVERENEKLVTKLIDSGADVNAKDKDGMTALFYGVEKENEKIVEKLLENGFDINATNVYGNTVLTYAIWKENEKMVEKLIDFGADVNAADKDGRTALFHGLGKGNEKIVEKLIECGADINATEKNGETPLFYAANQGNEKMLKTFIDCGADVNAADKLGKTPLFNGLWKGNEKIVQKLIEWGADVNATNTIGGRDTNLLYAVEKGKGTVVSALIDAGADVNKTDEGESATFSAFHTTNNESVVRALIDAGADVNRTDIEGKTSLFYAVQQSNETVFRALIINSDAEWKIANLFYSIRQTKNESVVQALIAAGADVSKTYNEGKTALFYAVQQSNNESVVQALIDAGSDVHKTDEGKTALFYAVQQSNNESVVRALIAAGADVNITDNEGKTTLFYAVQQSNNESVVRALIDAGADVNITDNEGKTTLFYAVQQSDDAGADVTTYTMPMYGLDIKIVGVRERNIAERVVHALIDAGADVNITDNEGKTALFFVNSLDETCFMARMLIEDGGADVDVRDRYGRTPLFYAMIRSVTLPKYLLDKGASLHLNENCSVLTFFIEESSFGLSNTYSYIVSYGLNLLAEHKKVERKRILEAIVSVAFCKILYFKPGSCDIDVDSLSELMGLAKENTSKFFQAIFLAGKNKTISDIFTLIDEKCDDQKFVESRAALELSRLLVRLGANPNTTDSDGNTALHHATQLAFHGVTQESIMEICQQLETLNVSIHVTNHQNETPLLYCLTRTIEKVSREEEPWPAIKTQAAICRFLVEHGSSVEVKTGNGETLLHLTLKLLQHGFFKLNSELGKDICDVALDLLEVFVLAFRRQEVSINTQDNRGNTPLYLWAKLQLATDQDYSSNITEGHTFQRLLKMILDHLTEKKEILHEETLLHLCATWTAVELLLDAGANPNVVDSSGGSPLLVAARNNESAHNRGSLYPDILLAPDTFWRTVLNKGLNPWTVDRYGESVLSVLITSESHHLARALVDVACDQNSPAYLLVLFSLLSTICKDKLRNAHWKKDAAEMILSSTKCPVNGNDKEDSPLHYCCRNIVAATESSSIDEIKTTVHWSMVKMLRSFGADYRIPDAIGQSCLDIAEEFPALKDLLMEPINLDRFPVLIKTWKSVSKTHERCLAKVARHLESASADVKSYWYYKDYLARGSFGAVFVGINEKDGREVAIKRIEKRHMQRPEDKREITNLTALADCEHIVRYLHFFGDKHFFYIVLELMEGNLDDLLDHMISVNIRVQLCHDVLMGLKVLHDNSILHRDIKPTNILYKQHPKLCLKIADFGLSRRIDSTSTTVYGTNAGTRCWIAPEVLTSTKPHSKSSDMFACGLVLHYILSVKGHPFAPRTGALQHETEANILKDNMEGWDDSLCPETARLLKSMLDGDESKRPAADKALHHPFFWSKKKRLDLLIAVGNQPEFECPRAKVTYTLTAVENDLEEKASFDTIVRHGKWNDPGYVHMPAIYTEMMRKRKMPYDPFSVVELVRFIRNATVHVSGSSRPTPIKKQLLVDFVFLEYFPDLVMEVYKAVTTHGWDQTREEIKYALQ